MMYAIIMSNKGSVISNTIMMADKPIEMIEGIYNMNVRIKRHEMIPRDKGV